MSLCFPFYKLLMKDVVKEDIMLQIKNIELHSNWIDFNLHLSIEDIDLSTTNSEDIVKEVKVWRNISKLSIDLWRDYDHYRHFTFETQFTNKEYIKRLEMTGLVLESGIWSSKSKPDKNVVQANVFIFCLYQQIFNKMSGVQKNGTSVIVKDQNKKSFRKARSTINISVEQEKKRLKQKHQNINDLNKTQESKLCTVKPCYVNLYNDMLEVEPFKAVRENKESKQLSNNIILGMEPRKNSKRKAKSLALNNCNPSYSSNDFRNRLIKKKIIEKQHEWECRKCEYINQQSSKNCLECKKSCDNCVWICAYCSQYNKPNSTQCKSCSATKSPNECPSRLSVVDINDQSVSNSNTKQRKYMLHEFLPCDSICKNVVKAEAIKVEFVDIEGNGCGDITMNERKNKMRRPEIVNSRSINIDNSQKNFRKNRIRLSSLHSLRKRNVKKHSWKCKQCDSLNAYSSDKCVICHKIYKNCTWLCIICSQWNSSHSSICKSCGTLNEHRECKL